MARTETRPPALVTGASSGIEFQLAKQFADHGYDLVVAAEDEALADASRELAARGVRAEPARVDLSYGEAGRARIGRVELTGGRRWR